MLILFFVVDNVLVTDVCVFSFLIGFEVLFAAVKVVWPILDPPTPLLTAIFDEVLHCEACLNLLALDFGLFLSVLLWFNEFLLYFLSSKDLKKVLLGVFPV